MAKNKKHDYKSGGWKLEVGKLGERAVYFTVAAIATAALTGAALFGLYRGLKYSKFGQEYSQAQEMNFSPTTRPNEHKKTIDSRVVNEPVMNGRDMQLREEDKR